MSDKFKLNEQLTKDALDYHRLPTPEKLRLFQLNQSQRNAIYL